MVTWEPYDPISTGSIPVRGIFVFYLFPHFRTFLRIRLSSPSIGGSSMAVLTQKLAAFEHSITPPRGKLHTRKKLHIWPPRADVTFRRVWVYFCIQVQQKITNHLTYGNDYRFACILAFSHQATRDNIFEKLTENAWYDI